MKKNNKKRAFTLTELLVVVIVIGVLAAVMLPKFTGALETRRTTEAEDLMSAVRTEQEKRCTLDKKYVSDLTKLSNLVPQTETKNYTYTGTATGMLAARRDGNYTYTLGMPSYADGRICCAGEDCNKLNKDYPTCKALVALPDYDNGAGCTVNMPIINPVNPVPIPIHPVCFGSSDCCTPGASLEEDCDIPSGFGLLVGQCYRHTGTCDEYGFPQWGACHVVECGSGLEIAEAQLESYEREGSEIPCTTGSPESRECNIDTDYWAGFFTEGEVCGVQTQRCDTTTGHWTWNNVTWCEPTYCDNLDGIDDQDSPEGCHHNNITYRPGSAVDSYQPPIECCCVGNNTAYNTTDGTQRFSFYYAAMVPGGGSGGCTWRECVGALDSNVQARTQAHARCVCAGGSCHINAPVCGAGM